jgi:ABC-type molybdate transport system permease subunit
VSDAKASIACKQMWVMIMWTVWLPRQCKGTVHGAAMGLSKELARFGTMAVISGVFTNMTFSKTDTSSDSSCSIFSNSLTGELARHTELQFLF